MLYLLYERTQDGRDYYDHILGVFDNYELAVQHRNEVYTLSSDYDIVEIELNKLYKNGVIKP